MRVTVIVVNYNTAHLLPEMFTALELAASGFELECIVIDNASCDDSVALMRRDFPQHQLLVNQVNVGFGRANNQALPFVSGDYVLLLNTDAFVAPDTLSKTVTFMEGNQRCGVLGVRLLGRDGKLQPCCRYFPTPLNTFLHRTNLECLFPGVTKADDLAWDHVSVRTCDWVPGCYYLVRREVINQIGLFDPRYFLYFEEVDHCKRVKAVGWEVIFYPDTSVVHIGGESAKAVGPITASGRQISALQLESELLYIRKHYGRAGLMTQIILLGAGDLILATKQLIKRLLGISSTGNFQPLLASSWRLLVASDWGRRPLH